MRRSRAYRFGCPTIPSVVGLPAPDLTLLFQAGARKGVYYRPWVIGSLFQLPIGTVPVTADGDPVGHVADASGGTGHAIQTIVGARPLYKIDESGLPYILFDGVDDLLSAVTTIPLKPNHTCILAVQRGTATAGFSLGSSQFNTSEYARFDALSSERIYATTRSVANGYALINTTVSYTGAFPNVKRILTRRVRDNTTVNTMRVSGVQIGSVTSNWPAAANLGNTTFLPGPVASTTAPGFRLYGYFWIDLILTDTEVVLVENEFARRMGLTL